MPLGSAINSLRLLLRNMNPNKPTELPLKHRKHDKAVIFPSDEKIKYLPRSTPEEHGYTKEYIDSFFREISSDLSNRVNRILIVKDNFVIAEKYEYPYVPDAWDMVFSTTKTVVCLAIGILYDEGKIDLDVPVYKILGVSPANIRNKKITFRHLLTMSTGVTFNEIESATSLTWLKGFFDSGNKFKVGSKFEYNSLNTYILSVLVEKLSGMKFEKFIKEKLFNHLDMNSVHLDTSPEGYFKGGWGLYILPEDMAKLGILIKDKGVYNGERLVSEQWINMMTSIQYEASKYNRRFDYGFQMWIDKAHDLCFFNGMYNQDILIYNKSGVVVVVCCANNEGFHGSTQYDIIAKYFSTKEMGNFPLCKTYGNRDLVNYDNLMYYYDKIVNKEYKIHSSVANSCGVLPLLIQNEVGTYARGVKGLKFLKEEDEYVLVMKEGTVDHRIRFNFKNGIRQTFNFYGNLYDCICDGRFILSGKGDPFMLIRIYFLEFPSTRYISVKFGKDDNVLSIEESENPGFDFVMSMINEQDESTKAFVNSIVKTINPAKLSGTIKNIFAPVYIAKHGKDKTNG